MPDDLPDAGRFEIEVFTFFCDHLPHVTVEFHDVVQNLSGPPHKRIAVEFFDSLEIRLGQAEWQKTLAIWQYSTVESINYGQFDSHH